MKLLRQSSIILSFWIAGEIIRGILKIPIPGNVIGMILLFAALSLNILKLDSVDSVSDFLLSHLAFFFIPPSVGLISCLYLLKKSWVEIIVISLVSTVLVMLATGFTIQLIQKGGKR